MSLLALSSRAWEEGQHEPAEPKEQETLRLLLLRAQGAPAQDLRRKGARSCPPWRDTRCLTHPPLFPCPFLPYHAESQSPAQVMGSVEKKLELWSVLVHVRVLWCSPCLGAGCVAPHEAVEWIDQHSWNKFQTASEQIVLFKKHFLECLTDVASNLKDNSVGFASWLKKESSSQVCL